MTELSPFSEDSKEEGKGLGSSVEKVGYITIL